MTRTRPGGDGRRYREFVWRPKDYELLKSPERINISFLNIGILVFFFSFFWGSEANSRGSAEEAGFGGHHERSAVAEVNVIPSPAADEGKATSVGGGGKYSPGTIGVGVVRTSIPLWCLCNYAIYHGPYSNWSYDTWTQLMCKLSDSQCKAHDNSSGRCLQEK